MRLEDSIRRLLLLAFRAHRKKPRRFIDDDDGVIQMHDSESMAFQHAVADLGARGDRHYVSGLQFRIVTDRRLALHGYCPKPEKILSLFARQSCLRSGQVRQELAT